MYVVVRKVATNEAGVDAEKVVMYTKSERFWLGDEEGKNGQK